MLIIKKLAWPKCERETDRLIIKEYFWSVIMTVLFLHIANARSILSQYTYGRVHSIQYIQYKSTAYMYIGHLNLYSIILYLSNEIHQFGRITILRELIQHKHLFFVLLIVRLSSTPFSELPQTACWRLYRF